MRREYWIHTDRHDWDLLTYLQTGKKVVMGKGAHGAWKAGGWRLWLQWLLRITTEAELEHDVAKEMRCGWECCRYTGRRRYLLFGVLPTPWRGKRKKYEDTDRLQA